jgi:hypothetical protein
VLVASAFVLGLVIGAAAFVGVWRTTASQGDRANAARALAAHRLRDAQARSATLSRQLHGTKTNLLAAVRREQQLKLALGNAEHQAARSGRQAANDHSALLRLRHQASTVTSVVAALDAYVRATPTQTLDGGFLRSQVTYLTTAAHRLREP